MATTSSPFEYLIAFAIVFAAGVFSSMGLRQYTERMRRKAMGHA